MTDGHAGHSDCWCGGNDPLHHWFGDHSSQLSEAHEIARMNTSDSKWGVPHELIAWVAPIAIIGLLALLMMPWISGKLRQGGLRQREVARTNVAAAVETESTQSK